MGQCKFAIESLYYKDIFSQNIPVIEYQCITDFSLTAMPPAGDIALRQACLRYRSGRQAQCDWRCHTELVEV